MFSSFGFKPPASGFQSYSYSNLKTSPSTLHQKKTSRLKDKRLSTLKGTQRVLQSYMEKRRGRREIEVTGIEEGESKGRDQSSQ